MYCSRSGAVCTPDSRTFLRREVGLRRRATEDTDVDGASGTDESILGWQQVLLWLQAYRRLPLIGLHQFSVN